MVEKKKGKRTPVISKARYRNLPQYKNMSEEEFDKWFSDYVIRDIKDSAWDTRIKSRLHEYRESYDLDSLMPNDISTLEALIRATIRLEDYEMQINRISENGLNDSNIFLVEKLGNLCTGLRKNISDLQDTLKISRKIRKSEKEESVINFIEDLKHKAKRFYDQKMLYVFCPECNQLLGTVWLQHWDSKSNRITLHCNKEVNNKSCNTTFTVNLKELWDKKQSSNIPEVLPESMR